MMPIKKMAKVKAGQAKLREYIKNELAKKGARVWSILSDLRKDVRIASKPKKLDAAAEELRFLAFQIRNLQNAKKATEEA